MPLVPVIQTAVPRSLNHSCIVVAVVAIVAGGSATVHAASALEECSDRSPTLAAVSTCLDDLLTEAERDLAAKSKLARQSTDAIPNRDRRAKAQRAFDRSLRRFFAEREALCGNARPDAIATSERANQTRDCFIQLTRQRTAEIAASLPQETADSGLPQDVKPAVRPPTEPPPQPSPDPVYGVEWHLTRLIRDNKEVTLPANYRATLRLDNNGRVSGTGAASAFSGRFRLRSPGKIEWTENGFLTTHVGTQADQSQVDYLYVDSLERTTRAGSSKTGLVLRNEDGSVSLSFER